jgi:hypothetical protein
MILVVANLLTHFPCFSYRKIDILATWNHWIKYVATFTIYGIITELEIRWVHRSAATGVFIYFAMHFFHSPLYMIKTNEDIIGLCDWQVQLCCCAARLTETSWPGWSLTTTSMRWWKVAAASPAERDWTAVTSAGVYVTSARTATSDTAAVNPARGKQNYQ